MNTQLKHTKKITAVLAALMIILIALICLLSSGCSYTIKYDYIEYEGGEGYYVVKASGYVSSLKGELVIPSTYGEGDKEAPVKEIADEGFRGSGITRLVIPRTITKIGTAAFANCDLLLEVEFEEGIQIEEIPQGMFGFDSSLREITIPETVKTIGFRAFYGCTSLSTVTLPQNLKKIGENAFEECAALSDISLPDGLESIEMLAFYFSGIKEIVIPDSVQELGYGAFHTCRKLKKAVVGKGIEVIKAGVFGFCDNLEEIYIPLSVTKIEGIYMNGEKFVSGHAFHNCSSLKVINYEGTAVQWTQIDINNEGYVSKNGASYNNNSLFKSDDNTKLNIYYNKSYTAQA